MLSVSHLNVCNPVNTPSSFPVFVYASHKLLVIPHGIVIRHNEPKCIDEDLEWFLKRTHGVCMCLVTPKTIPFVEKAEIYLYSSFREHLYFANHSSSHPYSQRLMMIVGWMKFSANHHTVWVVGVVEGVVGILLLSFHSRHNVYT